MYTNEQVLTLLVKRLPDTHSELKTSLVASCGLQREFARQTANEILWYNDSSKPERHLALATIQLQKIKFSPREKGILDKIKIATKELNLSAYLAGGIVRDRLLGRESSDLDIVVNKDAENLANHLVKKFGLSPAIRYDRSQAIAVVIDKSSVDIINAARVVVPINEQESLEGTEEFTISFDDIYRRDLTINSLLWDIQKEELIDYTGRGLKDLREGRIRTIIDPFVKYKIHAPDILRAIRFAVTLSFTIDERTKEAMRVNAARVKPRDQGGDISNRRVRRELRKAAEIPEQWEQMKQLLVEVGLFDILREDIDDVNDDVHGKYLELSTVK